MRAWYTPGMHRWPGPWLSRIALLAACLGLATSAAARRQPVSCPDGRFRIQGKPLLASAGAPVEAIVLDHGRVGVSGSCQPVLADVKPSRHATHIRATLNGCAGTRTRLRAVIASKTCDVL